MTLALYLFLGRTFYGRAINGGVAGRSRAAPDGRQSGPDQDHRVRVGIAAASLAGALLITISPVVPSSDRDYIGRMFRDHGPRGMGSIGGTLVAAIILGGRERVGTFFGPSWSLAVSFGILLVALRGAPAGLFAARCAGPASSWSWACCGGGRHAGGFPARQSLLLLRGLRDLQYVVIASAWNILGGTRLRELRHPRVLRARRLHRGVPHPIGAGAPAGADPGRRPGLRAARPRIGYLTLRLRGVFFSIATLALSIVLQTVIINWSSWAAPGASA